MELVQAASSLSDAHAAVQGLASTSGSHVQQLYALADAAAAAAPAVQRAGGWVAPLADALEQVLYSLQGGLDRLGVPFSYGYSIILLTLIVKTATFPLTKQQASLDV